MKITIELELTDADVCKLRQNSLERVMNTAITVGDWAERHGSDLISEYGSDLQQDARELKRLATQLWFAAREGTLKIAAG